MRSAAAGVGNVVVLFGASTGRDGIGGASVLASAELGDADEDKRPTVQVGDPFEEKKLLECSLELLDRGLLVALQDLGAAGLTSSASEMASKGGVGIDIDVAAGAAARARHGAVRDHGQRVAGADALRRRAGTSRRGDRRDRSLGGARDRDRDRHRHGRDADLRRRAAGRRDAGRRARRRLPALRPRAAEARRADLPGAAADAVGRRDGAPRAAGAAGLAEHRFAAPAVRAVRLDRAVAHRAPPRAGRRRGAGAARRQRARGEHRRQRPPRRRRSLPRHDRRRAGVRLEPGMRGRRAARHDEQPQLRQPREAAHRLAADRVGARPGRRLPRAGRADRRRQRLALQRGRRGGPDLPDARRRHGRQAARRGARRPARLRAGGRRGRDRRPLPAVARGERARQAARRAASRRAARNRSGARAWACTRTCAPCAPCPRSTTPARSSAS